MLNQSTLQFVKLALSVALFLTPFQRAALAARIHPPPYNSTSLTSPAPDGLVVVLENKPGQPLDLSALSNPNISGVALQIHWSDLEPSQGIPDWTQLDALFAAAQSSHKWVQLLIFPGFFSPSWAVKGAQRDQFPIQYGPGKGTVETLPMPWDPIYLRNWFGFVKLLSDKYGDNPAFRVAAAAGPTSVSVESTLPGTPADLKKWQKDGFTPSKYEAAWLQAFQTYASDFPNQFVSLSLGDGLKLDEEGSVDPGQSALTRNAVVNEGMSALGSRFVLQESNLDGTPVTGAVPPGISFVIRHIARCITGFQLRTACEKASANMGAAGNPPLALSQSIENGLRPNKAGNHVNYIEIYEGDVAAAEMQSVLSWGASQIAQSRRPPGHKLHVYPRPRQLY